MVTIEPIVLAAVAEKLDRLGLNYAFVGGTIIGMLLDEPELSPVRPTDDIDLIIEVLTPHRYSDIEAQLRRVGFSNDTRQGAPMCRWLLDGITVDIMPTEGNFLGLNTAWFREALESAVTKRVGRFVLRIISAAAFIATKLAAFADRGKGDYLGSHDLEDCMTVIDGRATIVQEIAAAAPSLRGFVVSSISHLVRVSEFQEALPAFLASDQASQARLPQLRQKLEAIAGL